MLLTNSAEGVTPSGTTATQGSGGNTGGASGNFFDVIVSGGAPGGAITSDSAHAAHGGLAYNLSIGATLSECYLAWTTSIGTLGTTATAFTRAYLYVTANPGTQFKLITLLTTTSTACGSVQLSTTGKLVTANAAGSTVRTSTNSIPLNQWCRVEFDVTPSTTVGVLTCRLYSNADDTSALETLNDTGQVLTAGPINAVRFGPRGTTVANIGPFWLDDIGITDVGPMGPSVTAAGGGQARPGRTWLRRFHHRQALPQAAAAVAAPQAGPPVYPLGRPVQARQGPLRGGAVISRDGVFAQAGPPPRPARGPVRAQPAVPLVKGRATSRSGLFGGTGPAARHPQGPVQAARPPAARYGRATARAGVLGLAGPPVCPPHSPVQARGAPRRGGSTSSRAGVFTSVTLGAGPPVYPLGRPVQAKRLPRRGGQVASRDGAYAGTGPAVRPPGRPARATQPPPPRGWAQGRAGVYTLAVTGSGPPVYPLGHPVSARRLPTRGGNVLRRAGPYAGTGPPPTPPRQPAGVWRRQPPPRGRVMSLRGPRGGSGPPAAPQRAPVRARLPVPVLAGRAGGAWIPVAPVPPPAVVYGHSRAGAGAAAEAAAAAGHAAAAAAGAGTPPEAAVAEGELVPGSVYPARYTRVYLPRGPGAGRASGKPAGGGSAGGRG